MFSSIGGGEILVILVVALLVLGPDKLPGVMRAAGKILGELRRASTDFQRTVNLELAEDEARRVDAPSTPLNETAASPATPKHQVRRKIRAASPRLRSGHDPERP